MDDESPLVRQAVAQNPNTPSVFLDVEGLAGDDSEAVRQAVAQNPNTSAGTHSKLLDDISEAVRISAAEAAQSSAYRLQEAGDPATSSERLAELAVDDVLSVCIAAIQNPNLPFDMAARITANDPMLHALELTKSDAPVDMLIEAATSDELSRRVGAALNPTTPADVLAVLAGDPECANVPLQNPSTPGCALTQHVTCDNRRDRLFVAKHPNLLPDDSPVLMSDPDPEVAAAASAPR